MTPEYKSFLARMADGMLENMKAINTAEIRGTVRETIAYQFEHEFLIKLAPIWLACRWRVMGHSLVGHWPRPDLAFDLLGMVDYAGEMKEICKR